MAIKKSQLYNMLWESCNALRGTMDATQYKDYVLVMLFWKYISDKADAGTSDIEIPEGCHFNDICAHKTSDCAEYTNTHLKMLAEANGLQDDIKVNFLSKERLGDDLNKRVGDLIGVFEDSKLNFSSNREGDDDLIGDAYEFLMRKFAADSGKSKGQFYTPGEVSRLMAKLVGIDRDVRTRLDIYDPTCGSGSLLLRAKAEFCGDPDSIHLYGQESDLATKGMACMNLIVHGYTESVPLHGDTIDTPLHSEGTELRRFDYVVANPPFSQTNWIGSNTKENDKYGRWGDITDPATGRLIEHIPMPPASCGDYAFLLHIVKSMKSDGKAAVILPHGVLFRGKEEAAVREYLINKKIIRGIIGLPGNLFYGTGIPACILILDKGHAIHSKGIFMINAKDGFTKDGAKNRLREQDIRRIIDVWRAHEDGYLNEDPYFAHFATYKEIIDDNKCNLVVSRYVNPKDKDIIHDLDAHIKYPGGLPVYDVDEEMSEYWDICTTLKDKLYKPYNVEGYYSLLPSHNKITETIKSDESYQSQQGLFEESVRLWVEYVLPKMRALNIDCVPRRIIPDWSDKLLMIGKSDKSLVNAYEIYDQLMQYWNDEMQDDCYLISSNGWEVGLPTPPQVKKKEKNSKKFHYEDKQNYTYDEMVCELLPVSVIIKEFFEVEDSLIKELDRQAEECNEKIDSLVKEDKPEDFEPRYFWGEKASKKAVAKRLSISSNPCAKENEVAILQRFLELNDQKGKGAKKAKDDFVEENASIFECFDKINKTTITKRIQQILEYEPYPEELVESWRTYVDLEDKATALNAESKVLKAELKTAIIDRYAVLSEDEIKYLVVEKKWIVRISDKLHNEMNKVIRSFVDEIKALSDRYIDSLEILNQRHTKETELIDGYLALIEKAKSKEFEKQEIDDGVFPADWVLTPIAELSSEMCDGPFGSNLKTEHYIEDEEVRIIQLSNIGESGWCNDNVKYTSFEHAKTLERCIVPKGSIVIAKMMPAGRAVICPDENPEYILGSDAIKMIPNEKVVPLYFIYSTKSKLYLNQIITNTQGSTRARTSISKLREIAIMLPPKDEQQEIAKVLSDVDRHIETLQKEMEKYENIKQGMMQQLLTGKIRLV